MGELNRREFIKLAAVSGPIIACSGNREVTNSSRETLLQKYRRLWKEIMDLYWSDSLTPEQEKEEREFNVDLQLQEISSNLSLSPDEAIEELIRIERRLLEIIGSERAVEASHLYHSVEAQESCNLQQYRTMVHDIDELSYKCLGVYLDRQEDCQILDSVGTLMVEIECEFSPEDYDEDVLKQLRVARSQVCEILRKYDVSPKKY